MNAQTYYNSIGAQATNSLADVLDGEPRKSSPFTVGGLPMSAADPVGQFDRMTQWGFKLDMVAGRYVLAERKPCCA